MVVVVGYCGVVIVIVRNQDYYFDSMLYNARCRACVWRRREFIIAIHIVICDNGEEGERTPQSKSVECTHLFMGSFLVRSRRSGMIEYAHRYARPSSSRIPM